jgi:hypothetical protein
MKRGRKWLEIENIKVIFVRTHWDRNKHTVFRSVSKIAKSDYQLRHVRPSVWIQLGSHLTDFHEILYLSIFQSSEEEIQVSLKSDKNSGHFTLRTTYIFDQTLLSSS